MTKTLAYLWVLPNTLLGCLLGLWYRGTFRWVEGAIEVSNVPGLFRRIGQLTGVVGEGHGAMCLGHCILAPNDAAMAGCRGHERIHVRQYAFWGPFYLPLYFLWSWYLTCHGRDSYFDNPFEQEAYRLQHRGPDDASSVPTGRALRRPSTFEEVVNPNWEQLPLGAELYPCPGCGAREDEDCHASCPEAKAVGWGIDPATEDLGSANRQAVHAAMN
jgi:hypothetical protein